jgi:hypothetical protein
MKLYNPLPPPPSNYLCSNALNSTKIQTFIFIFKTRNNIKGHIGFDTKTAATNSNNQSSTENIKKHKTNQNIKISREENDLVNNKQKYSNIHHSRSKSGDVNIRKNHE